MLDIFPNTIPEEIWYPLDNIIPGIRRGYWISTYGRLYYEFTTKYYPNESYNDEGNRYISVYLHMQDGSTVEYYLHRLVMYVFCYTPYHMNLIVNHKDDVKYHNWVWNLEWTTSSGNTEHALENGLAKRGEDVSYATITNEQANIIANLLSQGFYPMEIQRRLESSFPPGVRIKQIAIDMANGQSWKHITRNYDMSKSYKFKTKESKCPFTDEQIHEICQLFEKYGSDMPYKALLNYIGYNYDGLGKSELGKISAFVSLLRKKQYKKEICDLYNYQYKSNDYRKLDSHKQ